MRFDNEDPIVVGGLGGSGTRVVAAVLRSAGVYIGDCLNEPLDNLWFTLLFRRPASVVSFEFESLQRHLTLFEKRMHGNCRWQRDEVWLLRKCALEFAWKNYVRNERFGFPWRVYRSFFAKSEAAGKRWGWKEPNAHVFLPLLVQRYPNLRYVHVLRHPLDVAFGKNRLQLRNWKHLFGVEDADPLRAMLQYYHAANARALEIGQRLGDERFVALRIEDLCSRPVESVDKLIDFCGVTVGPEQRKKLYALPSRESMDTDYRRFAYKKLQPLAGDVAAQFGYTIA